MPIGQRVYVTACAGAIAFALAYAGVDYGKLPHLYHVQLEHRFVLGAEIPGLPSGYVGLWLWALAACLAAGLAAWLVTGRRRRPLSERALGLAAAWTATAWGLAVAYFVWNNWP
jgi:hypothetical protein